MRCMYTPSSAGKISSSLFRCPVYTPKSCQQQMCSLNLIQLRTQPTVVSGDLTDFLQIFLPDASASIRPETLATAFCDTMCAAGKPRPLQHGGREQGRSQCCCTWATPWLLRCRSAMLKAGSRLGICTACSSVHSSSCWAEHLLAGPGLNWCKSFRHGATL